MQLARKAPPLVLFGLDHQRCVVRGQTAFTVLLSDVLEDRLGQGGEPFRDVCTLVLGGRQNNSGKRDKLPTEPSTSSYDRCVKRLTHPSPSPTVKLATSRGDVPKRPGWLTLQQVITAPLTEGHNGNIALHLNKHTLLLGV